MGIGGGTILIPSLIFLFNVKQQTAQSINLFIFIPTSIAAIITHYKNKNIEYKILSLLIISGVIGAFMGSTLASKLSSNLLRKMFSVFLFIMGFYEIFYKNNH